MGILETLRSFCIGRCENLGIPKTLFLGNCGNSGDSGRIWLFGMFGKALGVSRSQSTLRKTVLFRDSGKSLSIFVSFGGRGKLGGRGVGRAFLCLRRRRRKVPLSTPPPLPSLFLPRVACLFTGGMFRCCCAFTVRSLWGYASWPVSASGTSRTGSQASV